MLGAPVRPDPFPATRLPGHWPDPRWWPRFFCPIRRLLFPYDVPTAPYGEQSKLTSSIPISGIATAPPYSTHNANPPSVSPPHPYPYSLPQEPPSTLSPSTRPTHTS